jgi:prevent-host-death family protein
MAAWQATQAKAKFSELLDKTEAEGPQLVKRRKREFYVLTSEQLEMHKKAARPAAAEPFVSGWDALRPRFAEFFDAEFPRMKGKFRKVNLG